MRMRYAIIVIVAVVALRTQAQGVPCATSDKPEERHSANNVVIFFQPSLAENTTARTYDENGQWIKDWNVAPSEPKGKPSTYKDPDSFYPEKRFLATPDSIYCVQGQSKREVDRAQCAGWFHLDLTKPTPTPPVDIAIEAPSEVGVILQLPRSAGGGYCTRTSSGKIIRRVFDSETVSLALRGDASLPMPPPGCSAYIARRDPNGIVPVTGKAAGGQSGFAPSANGALLTRCSIVKVRVLK